MSNKYVTPILIQRLTHMRTQITNQPLDYQEKQYSAVASRVHKTGSNWSRLITYIQVYQENKIMKATQHTSNKAICMFIHTIFSQDDKNTITIQTQAQY